LSQNLIAHLPLSGCANPIPKPARLNTRGHLAFPSPVIISREQVQPAKITKMSSRWTKP